MRLRSLSVAVLAGLVLVPVTAPAAVAADAVTTVSSASAGTFKSSAYKRAKRAAVLSAVKTKATAPLVSAPTLSYSDQVLALTNKERTSRGLRALALDACADRYADSWATSLSIAGTLSHQPLSPILSACAARSVGENVAYGNVTPEQLVKMWMDSAGHRANLLNAKFTHIGVGAVKVSSGRVYAVQVFLAR